MKRSVRPNPEMTVGRRVLIAGCEEGVVKEVRRRKRGSYMLGVRLDNGGFWREILASRVVFLREKPKATD